MQNRNKTTICCFGSLMDIDNFIQGEQASFFEERFGSLMDIDNFIQQYGINGISKGFGSLMDIDNFIQEIVL